MTKLKDLAKLVRSKNAKPFLLTIDIMFENIDKYGRVKKSAVLSKELFSKLYRVSSDNIMLIEDDLGYAFKVTIPRPIIQGDLGEGDLYGGQQHSPLLELEIPD